MKVTGIPTDDGGKDYVISHEGKQYQATRSGSLFCCNGTTDTLRNIKQMILDGKLGVRQPTTNTTEIEPDIGVGLWDCVHPCALLALLVGDINLAEGMRVATMETLDNYGWLTECGSPDHERAYRDYRLNAKEKPPLIGDE